MDKETWQNMKHVVTQALYFGWRPKGMENEKFEAFNDISRNPNNDNIIIVIAGHGESGGRAEFPFSEVPQMKSVAILYDE